MRATGLKIGRKHAGGYRLITADSRQDLGPVLAGLTAADTRTARTLLRRGLAARGPHGVRLKPSESAIAIRLARAGVLSCEERAVGTAAQPHWIPWRARLALDAEVEVKEALGVFDAEAERRELIAAVGDAEALGEEVALLRAHDLTLASRVPPASKAGTRSWSVYAATMRCVAEWQELRASGVKPSSREVAARALGSSKAWTPARRKAFESLIGRSFDEAMNHTEPVVKFRGPIRWQVNGRIGDGLSSGLWIGLPASTVNGLEIIDCSAEAILVVENEKTFEEVLRRSGLSERVLCVYGGGFLGEAEIALLRRLHLPTFAWADLDPKGIEIVRNIAKRIGHPVTPILMTPDLLVSSPSRPASPEDVALAESLSNDGLLDGLADLAARIADAAVKVEQEAMHDRIPQLVDVIDRQLTRMSAPKIWTGDREITHVEYQVD